ncbi:MAG: hypothetical protein BWK79_05000 [Beggiatoa sp. IS2]|nr:MAG: hypothetical protein BWK79_05000 [Beggiatoa sp. IS2]
MKLVIKWSLAMTYLAIHLLLAVGYATEEGNNPYAGKYELVTPPVVVANPKTIEIVELFWYTCPHCYFFEKNILQPWLKNKPADVEFIHQPAVFNERNVFYTKVYYTAEALHVLDKVHMPIFEALHDQQQKLEEEGVMKLFSRYGVSEEEFKKTFNSFMVDTKVRQANELTVKYGNKVVPTIVINGKYRMSSEITDGYDNMMKIIDYLIEKERKLMTTPTTAPALATPTTSSVNP